MQRYNDHSCVLILMSDDDDLFLTLRCILICHVSFDSASPPRQSAVLYNFCCALALTLDVPIFCAWSAHAPNSDDDDRDSL